MPRIVFNSPLRDAVTLELTILRTIATAEPLCYSVPESKFGDIPFVNGPHTQIGVRLRESNPELQGERSAAAISTDSEEKSGIVGRLGGSTLRCSHTTRRDHR